MKVAIELHGALRRLAGTDRLMLDAAGVTTVEAVLDRLADQLPLAREVIACSACARGDQLLHAQSNIEDGDTLVILPPVSGG